MLIVHLLIVDIFIVSGKVLETSVQSVNNAKVKKGFTTFQSSPLQDTDIRKQAKGRVQTNVTNTESTVDLTKNGNVSGKTMYYWVMSNGNLYYKWL